MKTPGMKKSIFLKRRYSSNKNWTRIRVAARKNPIHFQVEELLSQKTWDVRLI